MDSNIATMSTEETGGGVVVDYITLNSGEVVVIGSDSITLYGSQDKAFNEPEDDLGIIYL
jgi:hypothetical protein